MVLLHNDSGILPKIAYEFLRKHHELVKFALVGVSTMIVDLSIFYSLTLTFMSHKPTFAKIIAGLSAMGLNYLLNRAWSFKSRGGNTKTQEASLFFIISGAGVLIGASPEFFVSTCTQWRNASHGMLSRIIVDFFVNYIVGNLVQMIFRFWALRKFVFPENLADTDIQFFANSEAPVEIVPQLPQQIPSTMQSRPFSTSKSEYTPSPAVSAFSRLGFSKQKVKH